MSTTPLSSSLVTQAASPASARASGLQASGTSSRYAEPPGVIPRVCPDCAGPLARTSGCLTCLTCGWSRCG